MMKSEWGDFAGFSRQLKQIECPDDIGIDKIRRAGDGAINMRFCGQMYNRIDVAFLEALLQHHKIADIDLFKAIVWRVLGRRQIAEIAGIREGVNIHKPVLRVPGNEIEQKIGADKSGSTGYSDAMRVVVPVHCGFTNICTQLAK
jgi:hypothetical protein